MTLKRILAGATSALALGCGLVATAPAANASLTEYGCPTNYVCGYTGANFTGTRYQAHYSQAEGHCVVFPVVIHSLINMSSTERFYWWEYGQCSGAANGLLQYYGQSGYKYSNYLFSSFTHT
jgi:hypothetical protein